MRVWKGFIIIFLFHPRPSSRCPFLPFLFIFIFHSTGGTCPMYSNASVYTMWYLLSYIKYTCSLYYKYVYRRLSKNTFKSRMWRWRKKKQLHSLFTKENTITYSSSKLWQIRPYHEVGLLRGNYQVNTMSHIKHYILHNTYCIKLIVLLQLWICLNILYYRFAEQMHTWQLTRQLALGLTVANAYCT